MIELAGLICLVLLQALHVYHDYMKFKAHQREIETLKLHKEQIAPLLKALECKNDPE